MQELTYILCQNLDEDSFKDKITQLRILIDRHRLTFDFAQAVILDKIEPCTGLLNGKECNAVAIPFLLSNHRELATMNFYMRRCAKDIGLILSGLRFPDGGFVDMYE